METAAKKSAHTKGAYGQSESSFSEQRQLWIVNVGTAKGRVAEVTGVTQEEAEANAKRIVFAVNNLDKMLKVVGDLHRYETDEQFRAQMEANAQQVTDGNVTYKEALLVMAEGIMQRAEKEL